MAVNGQFVWFDLVTTSEQGAVDFYTKVVDWTPVSWDMGGGASYVMWQAPHGAPVGGIMTLPAEQQKAGVPPHWIGYILVADCDASAAKVTALGGTVLVPPTDIPTVGRFAVFQDPQGAVCAMIQSVDPARLVVGKGRGEFSWMELMTSDHEAAWRFYREIAGWKHTSTFPMGEMGPYHMFTVPSEDASMGGMFTVLPGMGIPPNWLPYVTVQDVDAAAERVKANGGQVINGPMDIPGDDRVVQCTDPQGAAFALYQSKSHA